MDYFYNKTVASCFDDIPKCSDWVDLEGKYNEPIKTFGGGKSGAFVFLLSQTKVLKYYTDAYKDADRPPFYMDNQRPFREYLSMCRMSGTPGFPLVYNVFCGKSPNDWISGAGKSIPKTTFGLAVVSSVAPGIPLLRIMEKKEDINPDIVYKIALAILTLISAAKEKLGDDFEHFDLHPDNVFVDMTNEKQYLYSTYTFTGPTVSLIDFDLVYARGINPIFYSENKITGPGYEPKEPDEWNLKRGDQSGRKTVAERTLKFLQQMVGVRGKLFKILGNASNIMNTDIRNWYVSISAMMVYALERTRQKSEVLKICQNVTECLEQNSDAFGQFNAARSRRPKRLFTYLYDSTEKMTSILDDVPEFIKGFLANAIIKQTLIEFQDEVFRRRDVYPTYDDTTIRFIFPCNHAWSLDITSKSPLDDGFREDVVDVDFNTLLMGSDFNIDIKTKAFAENTIDINFVNKFVLQTNILSMILQYIAYFLSSSFESPATYLKKIKEIIQRNRIRANTRNISFQTLDSVKDDFRFKHLKAELVGGDTNITATIEKPSAFWRASFKLAAFFEKSIKYKRPSKETRSITTTIQADPKAPPLLQELKKWFDKIKKLPGDELEVLLKNLLLQIASLIVFEEIRDAILLILCSYERPLFQLIYEYEDIERGVKVTKNITKTISSHIIFPANEERLTFLQLVESYERDTLFVFIHNVFNFVRQMCSMSIVERNKFFTKANKDINSLIKTSESIIKTKDFKIAKEVISNRKTIAKKIAKDKKVLRDVKDVVSTTRDLANKGLKEVAKDKLQKSVKRVKTVAKDEVKDRGKKFVKDKANQAVLGGPDPYISLLKNSAKKRRS